MMAAKTFSLILCSILALATTVDSLPSNYFMRVLQQTAGGCVARGFSGCCTGPGCVVFDGTRLCYCNENCYTQTGGPCCDDIENIGCYPTTCRTARLDPGCCFGLTFSACRVTAGNCHCDLLCRHFNDCCTDVDRSRLCIPQDAETEGKQRSELQKEQESDDNERLIEYYTRANDGLDSSNDKTETKNGKLMESADTKLDMDKQIESLLRANLQYSRRPQ